MSGFKAVIFDLDGTLLDTLEDLANSMNRVLSRNKLPTHPVESYKYFVGDGASTLVRRVLPFEVESPEGVFERLLREFLEDYSNNWDVATKPYPGIDKLIKGLERKGLKMAILSNKPHKFTKLCVKRFLNDFTFNEVFGERPGVPRKPDPQGAIELAERLEVTPSQCIYLGDTSIDMKTAVAAGMYPVGVLWGFRDKEELLKSGAKRLISHPEELFELLQ